MQVRLEAAAVGGGEAHLREALGMAFAGAMERRADGAAVVLVYETDQKILVRANIAQCQQRAGAGVHLQDQAVVVHHQARHRQLREERGVA